MSPRLAVRDRRAVALRVALVALAVAAPPVTAQQLPLQREYPGVGPYECPLFPAPVAPGPDQAVRAGQLSSDALQAVILGELENARILLEQAIEADATSPELAYRHARVLEDLGMHEPAIQEYCRSIALGATEVGILDGRTRLDALYDIVRAWYSERGRRAFANGLQEADMGAYEAAAESFTVALDEVPEWANAVYNRAVVYERLGRITESLSDYRRYLQLTPSEIDPVVVMVSERIGALEGMVTAPTPNPVGALTLGVVFPGMGQYYSGRELTGTLVLSTAAAAVATGFLYKRVTVRCLEPTSGSECAPEDIVEEMTERPYLIPAVSAAGAVMVIGAIEAFVKARGRRREAEVVGTRAQSASGMRLTGPSVSQNGDRIDVNLVGLRFR